MRKPKVCEKCKRTYIPTGNIQRFCGSKLKKIGCSYLNSLENTKKSHSKPEIRVRRNKYSSFVYHRDKIKYYQPYYRKRYKELIQSN